MSVIAHITTTVSRVHESTPEPKEDMFGEHVSEGVGEQLHTTVYHPVMHHIGHSDAVLYVALLLILIVGVGLIAGMVAAVADEKIEGCTA